MNGYGSDQSQQQQQQHQSYSYMAGTPSLPTLRYQGQTPMQTRSGKRACSELSPISEGGVVDSGAMDTNVQQIIQESLRNAIPGIMRDTQKQLEASITDIVAKSIESFRKENQENLDYLEDRSSLKAMSEAEKLEQYNRRDNLIIYNVDEKDGETYEQTMDAVVSIAHEVGAEVHIKDISIDSSSASRKTKSNHSQVC